MMPICEVFQKEKKVKLEISRISFGKKMETLIL